LRDLNWLSALKKKLLNIFVGLLLTVAAFGQQDFRYSHNMFNQMTINPGYAGSMDMLCFNFLNRNQWMGIAGNQSPRSTLFSFNAPFTLFEKSHGAGLTIINNSVAFNNDLGLQVSYAYRTKMRIGDGKLGIGISMGFLNSSLNGTFSYPDLSDQAIPEGKQNKTVLDMGVGLFYKTDKIYMGISATHPYTGSFDYDPAPNNPGPVNSYFEVPHYYITAGYAYQLPNPLYELIPSFYIQNDGSNTTLSLNTNLLYNNRVWGGLSYNVGAAFTALFGFTFKTDIRFGVAYDYETSEIGSLSDGSLEVIVIYAFKLKKEKFPQRYKSIRFL
jgi:type IX secretion system PorP/SprF family membrane protein